MFPAFEDPRGRLHIGSNSPTCKQVLQKCEDLEGCDIRPDVGRSALEYTTVL